MENEEVSTKKVNTEIFIMNDQIEIPPPGYFVFKRSCWHPMLLCKI